MSAKTTKRVKNVKAAKDTFEGFEASLEEPVSEIAHEAARLDQSISGLEKLIGQLENILYEVIDEQVVPTGENGQAASYPASPLGKKLRALTDRLEGANHHLGALRSQIVL